MNGHAPILSVFLNFIKKIYQYPLISLILLAVLSNIYLILDYQVVNRSSLSMLWSLAHPDATGVSLADVTLAKMISALAWLTGLSHVTAAYLLMLFCHTGIALLLLLIARFLGFSTVSQWALIFLLLSHPNYNDFRSYIIIEPVFWLLWLLAIYTLLRLHKTQTILSISLWLGIFLCATRISVAGWFWLLLFPFGALFWRPWRRKSVAYALLGYAGIVTVLLFSPIYYGDSAIRWLQESILSNPEPLFNALRLSNNNWVQEGDTLMSGVFVISGASSLILVRTLISLGVAGIFLAIYAMLKRQYRIIHYDYWRIIIYAMIFDFFIAVVLLILSADNVSVLSFSLTFLLLLFAALGLSYIFKKMHSGRYSRLSILVIIWCMVAYFAAGFIIFGPQQEHLKRGGLAFLQKHPDKPVYSNDSHFLFYADKNPGVTLLPQSAQALASYQSLYYAYSKNRRVELPAFWQNLTPQVRFANRHGDELLVFYLKKSGFEGEQNYRANKNLLQ